MRYSIKKAQKLFSIPETHEVDEAQIAAALEKKTLPAFHSGTQSWTSNQIGKVGERFGFMERGSKAFVATFFVTKGGVLKTSLALNFARTAALNGIKTCVVGLDMQGDVTTSLGFEQRLDVDMSLDQALSELNEIKGLPELFYGNTDLKDLLQPTDLSHLYFIPETPELVALEKNIFYRNRREFWLKENVIDPLKKDFDLIVLDGSPNWNQLITNALVATDLLVSPLECKINNFRNFKMFETFVQNFRRDLNIEFNHLYVPTRLNNQRRLSSDIYKWYIENLPNCLPCPVRESVHGEESMALHRSVIEHAPSSPAAAEMKFLINKIWKRRSIWQSHSIKPKKVDLEKPNQSLRS